MIPTSSSPPSRKAKITCKDCGRLISENYCWKCGRTRRYKLRKEKMREEAIRIRMELGWSNLDG